MCFFSDGCCYETGTAPFRRDRNDDEGEELCGGRGWRLRKRSRWLGEMCFPSRNKKNKYTLAPIPRERAFILMTWHAIARQNSNSERSFFLLLLCAPLLAAAIPPITPLTPLLAKLPSRLSILHIVRCTSCVRMAQKKEKEYTSTRSNTSASPEFESKFAGSKNTIFFHLTYNFIWNSYKVR